MANPADKYAKKTFSQLESQMSQMYREAYKDINEKLKDFTRKHKAKDKQMQRDLKKGKVTQEQYASWLRGQVFIGQQWQDAKASLDLSIKNVMTEAANLTHQKSIDVFVDNANHTAYQIEKDHDFTSGINFTMYDRKTVSRLMLEDPELLPRRKDINGNKLSAWNTKVIANCVTQGVLQGESIDELSKRIARDTCIDAGRSSLLYARTAMTGAQNAGRVERMKEAEEMGIKVQKQWMATLDSRTRDSHAEMDGEIADTDKEFSNGLKYPGDPDGKPREVYNCRCTLVYHYPGYSDWSKMERTAYYEEGDPEYDPDHRNYETVKGMDYEQWVNYKQDQIRQRYGAEPKPIPEPEKPTFRQPTRDEYDGGEEILRLEREKLHEIEEQRQVIRDQIEADWKRVNEIRQERSQLDVSDPRRQELDREMADITARRDTLTKKDEDLVKEQLGYFHSKLVDRAESRGIEYNIPTKLETPHTVQEIVDRIGGGDMTQGSCASLGFCYVGQSEGYDVLDFRDGESRKLFARNCDDVLKGISKETGKPLLTEATSTGTGGSVKLIKQTVPGHEYYFSCGRHVAIVRSDENGRLEYMELQSRFQNGWKLLGYKDDRRSMDYTFSNRFGCGRSVSGTAYMMDVEDMKGSKIFHRTLGYINTAEDKQKKGATGHER